MYPHNCLEIENIGIWDITNFQNLELTEKSQKSAQKTASLKWHAFREKVKIKKIKIFENFWKISDFLMNFQNLELTEKSKNQPKKQRALNDMLFEKKSKN